MPKSVLVTAPTTLSASAIETKYEVQPGVMLAWMTPDMRYTLVLYSRKGQRDADHEG
jgi:hypothetical protein